MNKHKLFVLAFAACVAGAASGQEKQNAAQEQANQPKASASHQMRSARTAAGVKAGQQQDPQDRRERAEKVAAGLQKKANDAASAAASNLK